jgi:hypothetical protein
MYFVSFFYTDVFIFLPICDGRRISCYKKTKFLSGRISRVSYSLIHRGNLKAAAVRLFLADWCVLIRWVINLNPAVFQFSEIVLHWLLEVSRLANICCWSDTTLERIVVYALDLMIFICMLNPVDFLSWSGVRIDRTVLIWWSLLLAGLSRIVVLCTGRYNDLELTPTVCLFNLLIDWRFLISNM